MSHVNAHEWLGHINSYIWHTVRGPHWYPSARLTFASLPLGRRVLNPTFHYDVQLAWKFLKIARMIDGGMVVKVHL
jgi:hypothetical protein